MDGRTVRRTTVQVGVAEAVRCKVQLTASVEKAARDQGLSLTVASALPERVPLITKELLARQLKGLIVAAEAAPDAIQAFSTCSTPPVLINQPRPIRDLTTLGPDYQQGAIDAVRHLIDVHGYEKIGFIGGELTDERASGWRIATEGASTPDVPALEGKYTHRAGWEGPLTRDTPPKNTTL